MIKDITTEEGFRHRDYCLGLEWLQQCSCTYHDWNENVHWYIQLTGKWREEMEQRTFPVHDPPEVFKNIPKNLLTDQVLEYVEVYPGVFAELSQGVGMLGSMLYGVTVRSLGDKYHDMDLAVSRCFHSYSDAKYHITDVIPRIYEAYHRALEGERDEARTPGEESP